MPLTILGAGGIIGGIAFGYGSLWIFFGPLIGVVLLVVGFTFLKAHTDDPVLDSKLNINMQGGEKSFAFNKTNTNANEIAEFINKVEETLTAYNK